MYLVVLILLANLIHQSALSTNRTHTNTLVEEYFDTYRREGYSFHAKDFDKSMRENAPASNEDSDDETILYRTSDVSDVSSDDDSEYIESDDNSQSQGDLDADRIKPRKKTSQNRRDRILKCGWKHKDGRICQTYFTGTGAISNRNRHINAQHTRETTYPCANCPKVFYDPGRLNDHQHFQHDKPRPHICSFCNRRFLRPYRLDDHIKTSHSNQSNSTD